MAQNRTKLRDILRGICPNVYFQAPTKLTYPCIIYSRAGSNTKYADDIRYATKTRYTIKVIDRDPDSTIAVSVSELPYTSENPVYVKNNLYHSVFTTYF